MARFRLREVLLRPACPIVNPKSSMSPDAALPSALANICHSRGIEVIEAMPKSSVDIDEAGIEPAPAAVRLR
jgi:hypothetical protein